MGTNEPVSHNTPTARRIFAVARVNYMQNRPFSGWIYQCNKTSRTRPGTNLVAPVWLHRHSCAGLLVCMTTDRRGGVSRIKFKCLEWDSIQHNTGIWCVVFFRCIEINTHLSEGWFLLFVQVYDLRPCELLVDENTTTGQCFQSCRSLVRYSKANKQLHAKVKTLFSCLEPFFALFDFCIYFKNH